VANKFNIAAEHSVEVGTLLGLAALLSDCTNFAELCEQAVGAAARAKVITGPLAPAWDGGGFTKDELAELLCQAHLHPPVAPQKLLTPDFGVAVAPRESGVFALKFRRYARELELAVDAGNDLYMWFLDTITKLETEMMDKAQQRPCPWPISVQRLQGPAFGQLTDKPAQGEYLWSVHVVSWGLSPE
jgi:hypothetical protein